MTTSPQELSLQERCCEAMRESVVLDGGLLSGATLFLKLKNRLHYRKPLKTLDDLMKLPDDLAAQALKEIPTLQMTRNQLNLP